MIRLILLLLMMLLSGMACAKIYKWVDAQGVVHYQDHPRGVPEKFSTDEHPATVKQDTHNSIQYKTNKPLKTTGKSPTQGEKVKQPNQAEAQRKQKEACMKIRHQADVLEATMKADTGKLSHEDPAEYLREQNQLIQHRQYLEKNCNSQ